MRRHVIPGQVQRGGAPHVVDHGMGVDAHDRLRQRKVVVIVVGGRGRAREIGPGRSEYPLDTSTRLFAMRMDPCTSMAAWSRSNFVSAEGTFVVL